MAPQPLNEDAVPFRRVKETELQEISAPEEQLLGLAFSGGGIRSATFNLGVLQALAQLKLLHCFDYLSTVSGGGYIGSWLAAWIREQDGSKQKKAASGILEVETALSPLESPDPNAENVKPIQYLRRYSNYLTPKVGLFSADTWTMISIWLRNTLLNLLILIAFLTSVLLIPRWLAGPTFLAQETFRSAVIAAGIAAAALLVAVVFIGANLKLLDRSVGTKDASAAQAGMPPPGSGNPRDSKYKQGGIQRLIVAPIFISAWLGSAAFSRYADPRLHATLPLWAACSAIAAIFFFFLVLVALVGRYERCFYENKGLTDYSGYPFGAKLKAALLIPFFAAASAATGGLILYRLALYLQGYCDSINIWHIMSLGTPVFMTVFTLVIVLYIGLLGKNVPDDRREWWSRLGAWLFIYNIGWAALFAVSLYGPLFISWLIDSTPGAIAGAGIGAGWIASTIGGVLSGKSKDTGQSATTGAPDASPLKGIIAKVAPVIFIIGLLLALSLGIHLLALTFIPCPNQDNFTVNAFFCKFSACTHRSVLPGYSPLWHYHWALLNEFLKNSWPLYFAIACALSLGLATILSCRIDINEFSLHHFYKNRLVRCYLGANRGAKRKPNPFTGFDGEDDVYLAQFRREAGYTGPYPIINTALNLVHGEDLAWQERKAESFIMTPRFCGFETDSGRAAHKDEEPGIARYGYRPTPAYAYPALKQNSGLKSGIHIGTAMAISGAAASPNMGANSSPASGFLMTVFDVRLGWWLGNPRNNKSYRESDPFWGLGYLLAELLGLTDDRSNHIYLSDGGHFENLGIYELVRRQCRYIVVCDSEEDHDFKFGGLGNAIRKCRSDFGAEIDINVDQIRRDPVTKRSSAHCVVGNITYKSKNGDGERRTGYLVYIKSSLTGDEPADVLEYASNDPAFPHQSTADQWFNESQFESYRRLGIHVGLKAFQLTQEEIPLGDKGPDYRKDFFDALRQRWYPPSAMVQKSFTKHTEKLDELMERLRTDPTLAFLDAQFYHEWRELLTRPGAETPRINLWLPGTQQEVRNAFYFCNSLIQLMENVYIDLNLDDYYDHPDNRGWMRLFKEWMSSAMFRVTWAVTADTYGARFQTFCRMQLHQALTQLVEEPAAPATALLTETERALVNERMKPGDSLHLLYIEIKDTNGGAPPVRFRFGFALLEAPGKLRCIFVQDDLRNTGLERRASALFGAATPKAC